MTLPVSPALIALILILTLVVAVFGIYDYATGWQQGRRLVARAELGADRRMTTLMGRFDMAVRRTDLGRAVGRRLTAAGLHIPVATFLLMMGTAGAVAVIVVGRWVAPIFGIAAAVVVCFAFLSFLRRQEDRRREAFIAQLPELARVLSNATQAGLVMRTAIEIAADELPDPAGAELRRTADGLRLGQSVEDALRDLGERLPSRELGVLISTLVVSARAGGSLVTALRTIAETLDERKEIRREVKTIMGEVVVTNWAVGALALLGLVIVNAVMPGSLRMMSENLIGQVLLAISALLFVMSLLLIRRISRIDV